MTSRRKVESNTKNARKSTGPRTELGKLRASRNAVRHGLATARNEIDVAEVERLAAALELACVNLPAELVRATAVAELELRHVRKVRASVGRKLIDALDVESKEETSLLDLIVQTERLDRYEQRVLTRRRRLVRDMLV
jgi:hypothetical protein